MPESIVKLKDYCNMITKSVLFVMINVCLCDVEFDILVIDIAWLILRMQCSNWDQLFQARLITWDIFLEFYNSIKSVLFLVHRFHCKSLWYVTCLHYRKSLLSDMTMSKFYLSQLLIIRLKGISLTYILFYWHHFVYINFFLNPIQY